MSMTTNPIHRNSTDSISNQPVESTGIRPSPQTLVHTDQISSSTYIAEETKIYTIICSWISCAIKAIRDCLARIPCIGHCFKSEVTPATETVSTVIPPVEDLAPTQTLPKETVSAVTPPVEDLAPTQTLSKETVSTVTPPVEDLPPAQTPPTETVPTVTPPVEDVQPEAPAAQSRFYDEFTRVTQLNDFDEIYNLHRSILREIENRDHSREMRMEDYHSTAPLLARMRQQLEEMHRDQVMREAEEDARLQNREIARDSQKQQMNQLALSFALDGDAAVLQLSPENKELLLASLEHFCKAKGFMRSNETLSREEYLNKPFHQWGSRQEKEAAMEGFWNNCENMKNEGALQEMRRPRFERNAEAWQSRIRWADSCAGWLKDDCERDMQRSQEELEDSPEARSARLNAFVQQRMEQWQLP